MSQVKGLKDEQLVLLVQTTGDSDSFSELIRRYQASFLAFLVRFTGNRSLAEDIAQESFIKSYQKINNFKASPVLKPGCLALVIVNSFNNIGKAALWIEC